jgi:hypothetical protein
MSYWASLNDKNGTVNVTPHTEGGTITLGGSSIAEVNITYNYAEVFGLFQFSVRDLNGKTGLESQAELTRLAGILQDRPYKADYWAPTPGNAGHVIHVLLAWAKQHPNATWIVH